MISWLILLTCQIHLVHRSSGQPGKDLRQSQSVQFSYNWKRDHAVEGVVQWTTVHRQPSRYSWISIFFWELWAWGIKSSVGCCQDVMKFMQASWAFQKSSFSSHCVVAGCQTKHSRHLWDICISNQTDGTLFLRCYSLIITFCSSECLDSVVYQAEF